MNHEPQEIHLKSDRASRSRRLEAVRRARQMISHRAESNTAIQDEAFASFPAAEAKTGEETPALDKLLVSQIATQLRQLDEQRSHLESLLKQAGQP